MLHEEPAALRDGGGEDYVLLFTLPSGVAPPRRFGCLQVGAVTREKRVVVVETSGRVRLLTARGWDHLSSAAATIRS
jgi:thiamine monophosphate kinase